MNTREAADKLNTDAKRLRRFLRADNTYRNAGHGGRYEFTEKDIPTLQKRFAKWAGADDAKKKKPAPEASAKSDRREAPGRREVPAMAEVVARIPANKLPDAVRAERDRLSRERVDRLEKRLIATGLHISQIER